MALYSSRSKNSDQWCAILIKVPLRQYRVSNQDEHRRFVMINKVSIMTMEEICKVNNNNFMPMFFRYEII
ncbi:unnamed protein product, partial [Vitis vinifera]|uniref:Uncharacterized protein n=1 Tax=Vitis vinifera TaxID=29760 RepID=D7UD10_VITVI